VGPVDLEAESIDVEGQADRGIGHAQLRNDGLGHGVQIKEE